jgi:hypothetical protein
VPVHTPANVFSSKSAKDDADGFHSRAGSDLDYESTVSRVRKILEKVLDGRSDQNISFDDLCYVLDRAEFSFRQAGGSHKIYFKDGIPEIINVQPKGKLAKAYQVKQVRELLVRYKIEVK